MNIPSDWNKFLASDSMMARSYELVSDARRAQIKKFIACLCDYYGYGSGIETELAVRGRSGLAHRKIISPVSGAVLFCDCHPGIWNRILAAIMPAVCSGVSEIYVFMVHNRKSCPEILTSLELAGIENIFIMDGPGISNAVRSLRNTRSLAVVDLCRSDAVSRHFHNSPASMRKYIRLSFDPGPRVLVLTENGSNCDFDLLRWAHPDADFTVKCAEDKEIPPGFSRTQAALGDLLEQPFDLFVGSMDSCRESAIPRCFGHGMELFWIWPEIPHGFFTTERICWKEI